MQFGSIRTRTLSTFLVLPLIACGPAIAQKDAPWHTDSKHLAGDIESILKCLGEPSNEEDGTDGATCIDRVGNACAEGQPLEKSSTTSFQRSCAWRAIAAWEEVLLRETQRLQKLLEPGETSALEAAQSKWNAFVDANVDSHASLFRGGSLEGVVAAEERARMVAERALEIRRMIREREQE